MAILKINLLPPRIKKARIQRMIVAGAAIVGLVLLAIPVGLWYVRWMTALSLKAQIKAKETESKEYAEVIKRNNELKDDEKALAVKLQVLDRMVSKQSMWIRVLEAISFSQAHSGDLWLVQMTSKIVKTGPEPGLEITLRGYAFSAASVDEFVRSLKKSDIDPVVVTPDWNPDVVGEWKVVRFTLIFTMKTS